MNRLRNRLIVVFLGATLAPLGVTLWVSTVLLDRSLLIVANREAELDVLSKSLETTGREFYQRSRESLRDDAKAGKVPPVRFSASAREKWPAGIGEFWESGLDEAFELSGELGDRLNYMVRQPDGVLRYSVPLGLRMEHLSAQIAQARQAVERGRLLDRRRGFLLTTMVIAASVWVVSFIILIFIARRISEPIQQLTGGLAELATGNLQVRVETNREDEVGTAIQAFNRTAAQLQQNRDRLVYLTQLASWQTLARKMAHEVKNSLTPIRLTVEEMLARHNEHDQAFLEQAAQIVVEEVESLERRIRAFSEFAAEPPVSPSEVPVNSLLEERVAFLRTGHPGVVYDVQLDGANPTAIADEDLVKGVLTNLLENAAEAVGESGRILALTAAAEAQVAIEIHDSGPGLSELARRTLFQPTISFKKKGSGLGLSIARKSALLLGGDILTVDGQLGGAAFRVLLPRKT